MARTKKTKRQSTASKPAKANQNVDELIAQDETLELPKEGEESLIVDTLEAAAPMEVEEDSIVTKAAGAEEEPSISLGQLEEDADTTPSAEKRRKTTKRVVQYPEELVSNECYSLFLALYRDRGSVEGLIADTVKDLKKAKSKSGIKLIALILYLSDLKLKEEVKTNKPITSLSLSDLILDSQDNHLLPFKTFSKRSAAKLQYSVQFRRNAAFWVGIGRNFFDYREETAHRLLELLLELTTYNHRNLRFVATACVLSIAQGVMEAEKEAREALAQSKRKNASFQNLAQECHDLQEQLYIQVLSHRVRDVFAPTRLLCVVMIGVLTHCNSAYRTDDYLKYVGTALGDTDGAVRLEAVRQLIALIREEEGNEVVREVVRRYKARILFMSRDTQPVVIMAVVSLIDAMREIGLISGDEDGLVFELAIDADRNIGNRAFHYLRKYRLTKPLGGKKSGVPENTQVLIRVLEYLEEFAADAQEVNHVYFFVRNCAGAGATLVNEENEKVLNVEEMASLLSKQRQELGLTLRQLTLLAVLLKATVQLFHDNQEEGAFYAKMNEVVVPHIAELVTTYKTDSAVYRPLVEIIEYLQFPDFASISAIASLLLSLFEKEGDSVFGNRILNTLTHIHVIEKAGTDASIARLLHEACTRIATAWSQRYDGLMLELTALKEEAMAPALAERLEPLCGELGQLCNLLCYQDETAALDAANVAGTVEVLLLDVANSRSDDVSVELRFFCRRFQQLGLLYRLLAAKSPSGASSASSASSASGTPSNTSSTPPSLEDVNARVGAWVAAVQEDLRVLVERSQATIRENKRRREVLLQYATMVSDLLIPVGDALITEQVAQTFGDLSLLLLLGSMDADCAAGEEAEEQRAAQQAWVKRVLTPLYHCSVAHAATVLPAALLFFLTDYGEVATGMCKELLRALREKDAKVLCHLVQDALQYAFTMHKKGKRVVVEEAKNAECLYEHFLGVSRRLAALLGVQLNYELLVALFEMMRECVQFVATARSTEIVEFYEALLPFVPKLTKEARGYLLEDLDKSVEGYDEDVREALTAAMKEKDKEPDRNYVRVFAAFRAALMKEKVVKEKKEVEKEKPALKAIASRGRKRSKPSGRK